MAKKAINTILDIDGYKFETNNTIYEIVRKFDADAPDGYKNHGTSKLLNESAVNTCAVGFNQAHGLWDTGLYADSPMYSYLNQKDAENLEAQIKELILEPYCKKYRIDIDKVFDKDSKLDPTNPESEFWNYTTPNSFKMNLKEGKIYNTNQPDQLLELFIAIATKKLTPKEFEEHPDYLDSQFCVQNKEAVRTKQQEDDLLDVKASGAFAKLLEDEKKLLLILNYLNIKAPKDGNKSIIISVFKRWTEDKEHSYQNKKMFLETADMANTQKGYKELNYYKVLTDLYKKGIVKKEWDKFILGKTELGTTSLKNCASNCATKKNLESLVLEHME